MNKLVVNPLRLIPGHHSIETDLMRSYRKSTNLVDLLHAGEHIYKVTYPSLTCVGQVLVIVRKGHSFKIRIEVFNDSFNKFSQWLVTCLCYVPSTRSILFWRNIVGLSLKSTCSERRSRGRSRSIVCRNPSMEHRKATYSCSFVTLSTANDFMRTL